MSTINHRKKGSKEFLSIAFCVFVVVVVFSIIIIIIIIDNFPLFFSKIKKKRYGQKSIANYFFSIKFSYDYFL